MDMMQGRGKRKQILLIDRWITIEVIKPNIFLKNKYYFPLQKDFPLISQT